MPDGSRHSSAKRRGLSREGEKRVEEDLSPKRPQVHAKIHPRAYRGEVLHSRKKGGRAASKEN